MTKVNRKKKFIKVARRKLTKPIFYAMIASFMLYLAVGNILLKKQLAEYKVPQFVINTYPDKFAKVENDYLLLVTQEMRENSIIEGMLLDYINQEDPEDCSEILKTTLQRFNWNYKSYHYHVQNMFSMYKKYFKLINLDETIKFLDEEIRNKRMPHNMLSQVELLQEERDNYAKTFMSPEEAEFISKYYKVVQSMQKIEKGI